MARMGLELAAPVLMLLCLPGSLWSVEDSKGKGKGKSPRIISVDLNKLPAGLARQLLKHRAEAQKDAPKPAGKAKAKGKGKGAKSKGKPRELPRGLAKKPPDHPGRVNFEKRVQNKSSKSPSAKTPPSKSGKSPKKPPKKKKNKKNKDDGDSDN